MQLLESFVCPWWRANDSLWHDRPKFEVASLQTPVLHEPLVHEVTALLQKNIRTRLVLLKGMDFDYRLLLVCSDARREVRSWCEA